MLLQEIFRLPGQNGIFMPFMTRKALETCAMDVQPLLASSASHSLSLSRLSPSLSLLLSFSVASYNIFAYLQHEANEMKCTKNQLAR